DDAIMPQTIEAISHAKNAGVPLVVAINKIDLPAANVQKVKQDLLAHGVVLEEFGGTTLATPISAKAGTNVQELLDQILLQAELLDLKANPDRRAQGTVLEATLDPGKGPLATILVQNGTLRGGDDFICGQFYGRVRAMYDERGQTVDAAGPSTPVQVLGFEGVPEAGDTFQVMTDAAAARDIAQKRQRLERETQHRRTGRVKTLEDFMAEPAEGGAGSLPKRRKWSWARRKSASCSRSRRWARLPEASSARASSRAPRGCAWSATGSKCTTARWPRSSASRTTCARCARGLSAGSASRTSTTSRSAT